MKEIKELYAEELALLKKIQQFENEQKHEGLERVEKVILLLLYRIFSNLHSAMILTAAIHERERMSIFQLPIGILLRCSFTDCMFALYIQRLDNDQACEELDLRTIEYANSLLERREVYRDQVKRHKVDFDDDFIDHIYELTMEDHFLHLLTFDMNKEELEVTKQSKEQLKDAGFSKTKSVGIKEQKDFLLKHKDIETVVNRLYHYYRYFSQYEHFSENGQGDVLVSSNECGNDNIHLPSAIRALSVGVEEIMKMKLSHNT